MNDNSNIQETLQRISQNDHTLTKLCIDVPRNNLYHQYNSIVSTGVFNSGSRDDFSQLGTSIAMNTHIKTLDISVLHATRVSLRTGFYDGLRHNSSIQELMLRYTGNTLGDVGNELLRVYQDNKRLIELNILGTALQQNELEHVALTLRSCTNLKEVSLNSCFTNDERLLPLVEAIRGHSSLERIYLNGNTFGNIGCQSLATLLEDTNTTLKTLQVSSNHISNEGAVILANSLANNRHLRELDIYSEAIEEIYLTNYDQIGSSTSVEDVFSKLLCNTSSINSIHSSNHTLEELNLTASGSTMNGGLWSTQLKSLLLMNEMTNKTHVAIIKILKYHPNIDMEPLYNWDVDGERTLKSLPYVIAWFSKAREAVNERRTSFDVPRDDIPRFEDKDDYDYKVEEKRLSAIYQFALAMPLQFVPATHIKREDKKQKSDTI